MEKIHQSISSFLQEHRMDEKPLLVGFSGGGDSLALVHALASLGVPIDLAHFDHKWRSESTEQAKALTVWAEEKGLTLHLGSSKLGRCTELEARRERYQFFQNLYHSQRFEALVLAHHFNDQAETVLKRILEGANLTSLKGMLPKSIYENMPIWRPFLTISKKEIQKYLEDYQLSYIDDYTNRDPHYLRARMRLHLFPILNESFGKETQPALIRLGQYSSELDAYLKKRTSPYFTTIVEGPFGIFWDFSPFYPLEIIEVRYVLRDFMEKIGVILNHAVLEKIISLLQQKISNRRIFLEGKEFFIDRGKIFILQNPMPVFSEKMPLTNQEYIWGSWKWKIEIEQQNEPIIQNWRHWWEGKVTLTLDSTEYELVPSNPSRSKIWTNYKVPQFLRSSLPLIIKKGKVVGDFLSGRAPEMLCKKNTRVSIQIEKKSLSP